MRSLAQNEAPPFGDFIYSTNWFPHIKGFDGIGIYCFCEDCSLGRHRTSPMTLTTVRPWKTSSVHRDGNERQKFVAAESSSEEKSSASVSSDLDSYKWPRLISKQFFRSSPVSATCGSLTRLSPPCQEAQVRGKSPPNICLPSRLQALQRRTSHVFPRLDSVSGRTKMPAYGPPRLET